MTEPLVGSYIADKKFSRPLAYGLASLFMAGLAIPDPLLLRRLIEYKEQLAETAREQDAEVSQNPQS
ncbi:MAG: hypothetical protein E6I75_27780 [Chloroflexi bacterium]|nr:MAG: hypothetical protein E6I75_27780 [Chloroflexota bacterium]